MLCPPKYPIYGMIHWKPVLMTSQPDFGAISLHSSIHEFYGSLWGGMIEAKYSGEYGWGNHSNRPVPVYYQGFASDVLTKSIGQGFRLYDHDIPGIAGLTDQVHIYRTQLAVVQAKAG